MPATLFGMIAEAMISTPEELLNLEGTEAGRQERISEQVFTLRFLQIEDVPADAEPQVWAMAYLIRCVYLLLDPSRQVGGADPYLDVVGIGHNGSEHFPALYCAFLAKGWRMVASPAADGGWNWRFTPIHKDN